MGTLLVSAIIVVRLSCKPVQMSDSVASFAFNFQIQLIPTPAEGYSQTAVGL